ncbi:MAG: uracil phosphoribosyltransferase [Ruminiclostridium sp.]|nr:uracil phosphoribosyltransferase [Ruminiclostridium sp.]
MGKTFIADHALISHKIAVLRDERTGTRDFRLIAGEIAMLLAYEVFREMPTVSVKIKTPVAETEERVLSGRKPVIVPILRAGLGMMNGVLEIIPSAKVGHIGLKRDEVTHEPCEYYCNLPEHMDERVAVITDPMLATGGSAVQAVDLLKNLGCRDIRFMCIIAAPEGLEKLRNAHPDIDIYIGSLDKRLNEDAYIVPGLGDAGDRIFGTK